MQANCCTKQQALFNPSNLTWTTVGKGKFDINDEEGWTLLPNGKILTVEVGPAVLRPDGTVFATGANTCGSGHTAIYNAYRYVDRRPGFSGRLRRCRRARSSRAERECSGVLQPEPLLSSGRAVLRVERN
jgi:hypothetical protein